jgi:hypothetical protein
MSWMIWPHNPALSALALFLIALPFLYAARTPIHGVIGSLASAASSALRLTSRSLLAAARELRSRNRLVLVAQGREEISQTVEREFQRVTALIDRDLSGYPALQRKLLDNITRLEEDYKKAGEVPPPPPEWVKAVEAMAKLKNGGDGLVEKILKDISTSIGSVYDKVLAEYRRSCEERHGILQRFIPFGRSLNETLARVEQNITGLQASAARIDAQMDNYEQIRAGSDRIAHVLYSSAVTQFFTSGLVLAIAFGGAFVNFWLIARPMSAMVGGGQYIVGDFEASHIAALVIILLEATMGLFLMECLRITHLFPRIQNMDDRMRRRLLWASLSFLFVLAGVEVALAVMRDYIVAADIALKQGLGTSAAAAPASDWVTKIPVAGQMILGFILPFALAFVAIPLEYFAHAARNVFGALLVVAIRALAVAIRMLGGAVRHAGVALVLLYDAVIFLPLIVERAVAAKRKAEEPGAREVAFAPPSMLGSRTGSAS